MPQNCFNKPFEFLLYVTHSYIFPCVGTVIDVTKDVTACKEQHARHYDQQSRHVICDLLQYTHTEICYLFVKYKKG